MRCQNCDYPLWNLPARACPECGDAFAPSEFEFKPGAVKYCCPDCQQEYYGTSRKGHLRPSSFECVQCKRQLEMDEMVLLPAEGWDERVVVSHSAPWTRSDIGHVRRWFATVGWSYVRPGDLIAGISVDKGLGQSWAFLTITQLLVGLIGFAVPIVVIIILVSIFGNTGNTGIAVFTGLALPSLGVLVSTIVLALIWSVLIHATLVLTGGCAHPMGRTIACVFFASGTLAAQTVPCLGPYCFGYIVNVWWIVCTILMLIEGQKISGLRATLSVLWFPVLLIMITVGLYLMFTYSMVTTAANRTNMATNMNNALVLSDSFGIQILDAEQRGVLPDSAVDLALGLGSSSNERVEFATLVSGDPSGGTPVLPDLKPIDLGLLLGVPWDRAFAEMKALEDPPQVEGVKRDATRIGALIYCLPGETLQDVTVPYEDLWLLLSLKSTGKEPGSPIRVEITNLDATISSQTYSGEILMGLLRRVRKQDELRAKIGRGSLVDLVTEAYEQVAAGSRP
jgi:hypothetical protein